MGWGRTLLLGDIGNRLDIANTERDIEELKRRLAVQDDRDARQDDVLGRLVRENRELKLYLSALARRLVAAGLLDEAELATLVARIDEAPPTP